MQDIILLSVKQKERERDDETARKTALCTKLELKLAAVFDALYEIACLLFSA